MAEIVRQPIRPEDITSTKLYIFMAASMGVKPLNQFIGLASAMQAEPWNYGITDRRTIPRDAFDGIIRSQMLGEQ